MGRRVLVLNKPYDVVSQFKVPANAQPGQRSLADLVDVPGVYPVGRLDRDSEGLLILTDDGVLSARLTDPSFGHPRRYLVQVEQVPDETALHRLGNGTISIDGHRCRRAKVALLCNEPTLWPRVPPIRVRAKIPTAWIELVLTEGRNRQVRKMTAAVGHPTLRLVRVGIGAIELGELPSGTYRWLGADEQARLLQNPIGPRG